MGILSDMEIVVKSLKWKRPIHLDPYILGNAPTTAIPSGNMPTLKLENSSKKHCSSILLELGMFFPSGQPEQSSYNENLRTVISTAQCALRTKLQG